MARLRKPNNSLSLEELKQVSPNATISLTTEDGADHIEIVYDDYKFAQLKKDLVNLTKLVPVPKKKTEPYIIRVKLDNNNIVFEIRAGLDNPITVVDLVEVTKACLPFTLNLYVSTQKISFATPDSLAATKTVATIGGAIKNHFEEEITTPFVIQTQINNTIVLIYHFKWITKTIETINETVVNSTKYLPLMDFLTENPHPDVKHFIFSFRDSSKGMLAEMNLEFQPNIEHKKQYETSVFIRNKLADKFSALAIY